MAEAVRPHGREWVSKPFAEPPPKNPMKRRPVTLYKAQAWLLGRLAQGPVRVSDLRREADTQGISWRTMRRAFKLENIESRQITNMDDPWNTTWYRVWTLPGWEEARDRACAEKRRAAARRLEAAAHGRLSMLR